MSQVRVTNPEKSCQAIKSQVGPFGGAKRRVRPACDAGARLSPRRPPRSDHLAMVVLICGPRVARHARVLACRVANPHTALLGASVWVDFGLVCGLGQMPGLWLCACAWMRLSCSIRDREGGLKTDESLAARRGRLKAGVPAATPRPMPAHRFGVLCARRTNWHRIDHRKPGSDALAGCRAT